MHAMHAVVEREMSKAYNTLIIRYDLIRWIGQPPSVTGTILIAGQHLFKPTLCSVLATVYGLQH